MHNQFDKGKTKINEIGKYLNLSNYCQVRVLRGQEGLTWIKCPIDDVGEVWRFATLGSPIKCGVVCCLTVGRASWLWCEQTYPTTVAVSPARSPTVSVRLASVLGNNPVKRQRTAESLTFQKSRLPAQRNLGYVCRHSQTKQCTSTTLTTCKVGNTALQRRGRHFS